MRNLSRIAFLDAIRTAAISLVVLCHCTEAVYNFSYDSMASLPSEIQLFILSNFTLGRVGVPLFLFLTGYLVISKQFDTKDRISKFYKHNYLPLLVTCEIWIILYNLFNAFMGWQTFQAISVLKNMLFLEPINMKNAWYIPMILGVYIFIPYVARTFQSLSGKNLFILCSILFLYYFVAPTCNLLLSLGKLPLFFTQIDLNYSGGTYGFYLLLGYCYKRYEERIASELENNRKKFCMLSASFDLLLVMVVCTAVFQSWFARESHTAYYIWYNFALLPFIGFFCFILFGRFKKHCNIFYHLSTYSFAIYLIHEPIIRILVNFGWYFPNRMFGIYLLWGRLSEN